MTAPVARTMRTTWRVNVRDIAKALGIPVRPDQWIVLEDAEGDGDRMLGGFVDVVRWENVRIGPETT